MLTAITTRRYSLLVPIVATAFFFSALASSASAQVNWEGQTGAFITPFAYTSDAPSDGFGSPQVSFHFLDAGEVIGGAMQSSFTIGFRSWLEFGYTRLSMQSGTTPGLSPLFHGGFNTVHGKVRLVSENTRQQPWIPAISAGVVARTQVRHVGGVLSEEDSSNGDFYVVATKTVTQVDGLPFVINGGYKQSNASIFGIAGNATEWEGRWFGAAAVVLKGPAGSALIVGSEYVQQPRAIEGLAGSTVPATYTYFVRVSPSRERWPVAVDVGIAHAGGTVAPGVDLKARRQFALGVSYLF